MHKSGIRILNAYFFFWYLIPVTLAIFYPSNLSAEYRYGVDLLQLMPIILIFYSFYFVSITIQNSYLLFEDFYLNDKNIIDNIIFQSLKTIIFLLLAFMFLNVAGSSYRQQISVSSLGSLGFIFLTVNCWLKTEVIFDFLRTLHGKVSSKRLNILKIFGVLIPLIMFVNHAFDVFFIFAGIVAYFNFKNLNEIFKRNVLISFFLYFPLLIIAIFLVLLIGFGNKIGYEFFFQSIQEIDYWKTIFDYLIWRISIALAAIQSTVEVFYLQPNDFDVLKINFNNSLLRLSTILQINFDINEINTINRLNFINLFSDNSNLSSGTSPGLIAGLMMTANPIFIIAYIIFSSFVLNMFAIFINKEFNIFVPFILMIFFHFIFDNPLGLFVIPEVSFLYLVFFLFFYLCYVSKNKVIKI